MPTYKQIKLPSLTRDESTGIRHYITPEGKRYPSVTTILSHASNQHLDDWKNRVGEEEAKRIASRAAHRGTYVHSMCEALLKNDETHKNVFYDDIWLSFKPIVEKIGDVYAIETQLYSDFLKVAGTVDCVGYWNGKLSIIDFKTSTRRKTTDDIHSYLMQEAAYAVCWEERTGKPITQLVTLMAVEDDEPLVFVEHRDTWVKQFMSLRKSYTQAYGV